MKFSKMEIINILTNFECITITFYYLKMRPHRSNIISISALYGDISLSTFLSEIIIGLSNNRLPYVQA